MSTSEQFNQILRNWAEIFMRRSMHDFVQFTKHSGLSMGQLSTLFHLYHGEACGVSDVGDRLGVTNAAASQMVDRLVQLGLLERTEDPEDRRSKLLTLTPAGRALIQEAIEARRRWMEQLTNALTPAEQEAISAALILLTDTARELESETGSSNPVLP